MGQQDLRQKILDWQKENVSYLEEVKLLIQELKLMKSLQIICYFTASFQISHQKERENYAIGSFHIQNLGSQPLTNPHIGLKITATEDFDFSGKYVYPQSKQAMRLSNAWERINESSDKDEIWLKSIQKQTIEPGETLSFSNFQLKWIPDTDYSGMIDGITYGNELPEGIRSFNQININGKVSDKRKEEMSDEER